MGEVQRAWDLGVRCIVLFPKVSEELKTEDGAECFNENGLIPRAIRQIKAAIPQMAIMTDVALDPYSCDGHDGIVSEHGVVLMMRRLNSFVSRRSFKPELVQISLVQAT
jgi:porphobilinogen synthase